MNDRAAIERTIKRVVEHHRKSGRELSDKAVRETEKRVQRIAEQTNRRKK
jgi:hypothetical protein